MTSVRGPETRIETPIVAPITGLGDQFRRGAPEPPPNEGGEGEIPTMAIPEGLEHLMRRTRDRNTRASVTPLCLFQMTGHCCGMIHNGFCASHLSLMNIVVAEETVKTMVGGAVKSVSSQVTVALDPFAPSNVARYVRFFPFIESENFDPSEFSIGFKDLPSVKEYGQQIHAMSSELRAIIRYEAQDVKTHVDAWVNYMSARYNVASRSLIQNSQSSTMQDSFTPQVMATVVANINGGDVLVPLNSCTLVTQGLMGLFIPQVLRTNNAALPTLTSPANVTIIDSSICMNTSLLPFGTNIDNKIHALGTELRSNMTHAPTVINDEMVNRLSISIEYKSPKGCGRS